MSTPNMTGKITINTNAINLFLMLPKKLAMYFPLIMGIFGRQYEEPREQSARSLRQRPDISFLSILAPGRSRVLRYGRTLPILRGLRGVFNLPKWGIFNKTRLRSL